MSFSAAATLPQVAPRWNLVRVWIRFSSILRQHGAAVVLRHCVYRLTGRTSHNQAHWPSWDERLQAIGQLLSHEQPSFVGLQHIAYGRAINSLKSAPIHRILGLAPNFGACGTHASMLGAADGLALLYRIDDWKVISSGSEAFRGKYHRRSGSYSRRFLWAILECRATEVRLLIYSARLRDGDNESFRVKSAAQLLAHAERHQDLVSATILCVDLNSSEASLSALALKRTAAGGFALRDAFSEFAPHLNGKVRSQHKYVTLENVAGNARNDGIFVDGWLAVLDARLVHNTFCGVFPSSHYPVIADLGLAK